MLAVVSCYRGWGEDSGFDGRGWMKERKDEK